MSFAPAGAPGAIAYAPAGDAQSAAGVMRSPTLKNAAGRPQEKGQPQPQLQPQLQPQQQQQQQQQHYSHQQEQHQYYHHHQSPQMQHQDQQGGYDPELVQIQQLQQVDGMEMHPQNPGGWGHESPHMFMHSPAPPPGTFDYHGAGHHAQHFQHGVGIDPYGALSPMNAIPSGILSPVNLPGMVSPGVMSPVNVPGMMPMVGSPLTVPAPFGGPVPASPVQLQQQHYGLPPMAVPGMWSADPAARQGFGGGGWAATQMQQGPGGIPQPPPVAMSPTPPVSVSPFPPSWLDPSQQPAVFHPQQYSGQEYQQQEYQSQQAPQSRRQQAAARRQMQQTQRQQQQNHSQQLHYQYQYQQQQQQQQQHHELRQQQHEQPQQQQHYLEASGSNGGSTTGKAKTGGVYKRGDTLGVENFNPSRSNSVDGSESSDRTGVGKNKTKEQKRNKKDKREEFPVVKKGKKKAEAKFGEEGTRAVPQTELDSSELKKAELNESPATKLAFKEFYRKFHALERTSLPEAEEFAMIVLNDDADGAPLPESVHWRVYLELADLAKRSNRSDDARKLYGKVCELQPYTPQGWLEYSKLEEECGNLSRCSNLLYEGLTYCEYNESLMTRAIKHEEKVGNLQGARSLLARLKHAPGIEKVWRTVLEGALFEARAGNIDVARRVLKCEFLIISMASCSLFCVFYVFIMT